MKLFYYVLNSTTFGLYMDIDYVEKSWRVYIENIVVWHW